ncbi:hypothetical protein PR048_028556 [Dryococelus australis]|uniref:Uncharacterized protein n=1 Tax=Dryococelus australis TaxID=614101 RepID=A0ABQ9GAW3_9NEOP|nr:hypothetical protein PR048_028556 [Dryococelus australis]
MVTGNRRKAVRKRKIKARESESVVEEKKEGGSKAEFLLYRCLKRELGDCKYSTLETSCAARSQRTEVEYWREESSRVKSESVIENDNIAEDTLSASVLECKLCGVVSADCKCWQRSEVVCLPGKFEDNTSVPTTQRLHFPSVTHQCSKNYTSFLRTQHPRAAVSSSPATLLLDPSKLSKTKLKCHGYSFTHKTRGHWVLDTRQPVQRALWRLNSQLHLIRRTVPYH